MLADWAMVLAVAAVIVAALVGMLTNWVQRPRWFKNWHLGLALASTLSISAALIILSSTLDQPPTTTERAMPPPSPSLNQTTKQPDLAPTSVGPETASSATAAGRWTLKGTGPASVTVQKVTSRPGEIELSIRVDSRNDLPNVDVSLIDQDDTALALVLPSPLWGGGAPQAEIAQRYTLRFRYETGEPPTKVTFTFKDFYWNQGQRLRGTFPVPA